MNTVLRPVGPNPPRVYWIRRLVVLVALVVVLAAVAAVVWLVAFRGAGAKAAGASGSPGAPGSAQSAPAGSGKAVAAPVDCVAADLKLALVADAAQYPAGTDPVLQGSVTNTGAAACTVDAGDAAREVVVSSGADRIWSTKDCASVDTASRQLLLDGGARAPFKISWTRVRSAAGCPANLPAPRSGTYQVVASLLGTSTAPVVFVLQ